MKAKVISRRTLSKKHFFLLMIAPFLIGLFITLMGTARGEWNQEGDPNLSSSPKLQGWNLVTNTSAPPLIQKDRPITFASM